MNPADLIGLILAAAAFGYLLYVLFYAEKL
jgi:K+-transporting ATPase KdpF subunit